MIPRNLFDDDHELFRQSFRQFVDAEIVPHAEEWDRAGNIDTAMFRAAGAAGFLAMAAPEGLGGGGVDDFRFNVVITEELARAGVLAAGFCITLHNDICLPYVLTVSTDEQRARWLPGICSGQSMLAIAMTEPAIGSDLASMRTTAIRDGDDYLLNGSKTFITNGINSDLVIVATKTDPAERHRGMTLFMVERGTPGFERGRNLDKVGLHAQDTAELFFDDCRVPAANRLGDEGSGFVHLVTKLPQERLSIAVAAVARAQAAFDWTLAYVKERTAFGQRIGTFQHNRFALAEMRTEIDHGQVFVDRCVDLLNEGRLTAEAASQAKYWSTEMENRVIDRCLQLHGGYGYMTEYPIARAWLDARVSRIYGGTTEIMKEIIGKSLGV